MGRMAEWAAEIEEQEREAGRALPAADGPWERHGDRSRCIVCDAPTHDGACLWCAVPTSTYVPDYAAGARADEITPDDSADWDEEDRRTQAEYAEDRNQQIRDVCDGYPGSW